MTRVLTWLKHEAVEVGTVTLYFLGCFFLASVFVKVILAEHRIEFQGLGEAVITALILAKVVVVMGKTRAGTRFDARVPVALASAYKSALYFLATFLVFVAEKLFHVYREQETFGAALAAVWTHRDRELILAKSMCIGLALVGYHLYFGVDRHLGKGILWRVMWKRTELSR
ncbi:MAG TPA: hypothetical protein VFW70_21560 [Methylomirabilota bacterium]|nr:hypothetical protein [Methylomirabilota bacterium]